MVLINANFEKDFYNSCKKISDLFLEISQENVEEIKTQILYEFEIIIGILKLNSYEKIGNGLLKLVDWYLLKNFNSNNSEVIFGLIAKFIKDLDEKNLTIASLEKLIEDYLEHCNLKIEDLIEVPEVENSQATVKTEEHEVLVETFSKTESVEEESEKINNADITKNANFKDYNSELQEWNAQQFMDILDDFIGEAEEIIEELEKSFMVIERDSGNLELLNSIFRNMHTLKGNSGTLNLKVMNFIAHRAENILDKVRTKKLTITPEIVDLMLTCLDYFKEIIKRIVNKESPNLDINELVNNLDLVNSGKAVVKNAGKNNFSEEKSDTDLKEEKSENTAKSSSVPSEKVKETSTPPAPTKSKKNVAVKAETSKIRVDITKLDTVMNLMGEIIIDKIRFHQRIFKLKEIVQWIENILKLYDENKIIDTDDILNINISDKFDEYEQKIKVDSDLYKIHYERIENVKKILNEIVLKSVNSTNTQGEDFSISDNMAELRRINHIFRENIDELVRLSEHLSLISSELQEAIMQMRMVPVSQLFDKIPRVVRTLSRQLNKKVELEISGEETELDKTVIEKLTDPFIHIIRNAVDHGCEEPEVRKKKGKEETAHVYLSAEHVGNQVVIKIRDDGKGIDENVILKKAIELELVSAERAKMMSKQEILEFIFYPGFSSAEKITEVSGRGVGMDVVLSNINKLKGAVEIDSEINKGTTLIIRLPLTMAIMQVQLIKCSNRNLAIPISFIEETINVAKSEINKIGPKNVINLRGEIISVVRLSDILNLKPMLEMKNEKVQLVIIRVGDKRIGYIIDKIIGQQEIVIKSLGNILKNVKHISGASILGEGKIVLILDMLGVATSAKKLEQRPVDLFSEGLVKEKFLPKIKIPDLPTQQKNILVVDDSKTVLATMYQILTEAGYKVQKAEDGVEAMEILETEKFDLITADVMMPRMDGYKFVSSLRRKSEYSKVPVIMVSSKTEKIDKLRGLDAGADEYIYKPFDRNELLETIGKFFT